MKKTAPATLAVSVALYVAAALLLIFFLWGTYFHFDDVMQLIRERGEGFWGNEYLVLYFTFRDILYQFIAAAVIGALGYIIHTFSPKVEIVDDKDAPEGEVAQAN